MPDDESPNKNPFVRFKHHVDQRVTVGLQNIFGLPSIVSRGFAAGPIRSGTSPTAPKDTENASSQGPMAGDDRSSLDSPDDVEPRNPLQLAENVKDHIASVLDSFRGSSREECDMGWRLFLTRSPYSPLLLDRHLGWRPSPRRDHSRSQPEEDDYLYGGWTDAFDDLLRASSGLPMKDSSLAEARKYASTFQVFLHGTSFKNDIVTQAEHYLWELRSWRLDEVLFPLHDHFSYTSPRTMAEWVALRQAERHSDIFAEIHAAIRKGEEMWKEVAPSVERIREVVMEEPHSAETEEDAYRAVDQKTAAGKDREVFPKKWDDLLDFVKQIGEGEKPREVRVISSSERTKPTWSGGTKTVTKKEYVDENGATHTETVVSVKNAEGEETSRRVRHSIRSDTPDEIHNNQTKADARPRNADESDHGENKDTEKDNKRPSGWFWSRR